MTATLYLDVISSWCFWMEPAWARLRSEFGDRVAFRWKVALMDPTGLPVSRNQLEWFYNRSGVLTRSPVRLDSSWYRPELPEYLAPNLVAEAAKDFGIEDDRARLAIARAALLGGRPVADWQESAAVASRACDLDPGELLHRARTPEIEARARAATAEFHALGFRQRPAVVLENGIGDRATFSGLVSHAPLAATLTALLEDEAAYRSYAAHHGGPPAA